MIDIRHLPHRLLGGLAATGAGLLLAAAPAAADSIAYVKGGDVWLSTPDGGRQYQVTATGGYSAVSQANSGRMVGLSGTRLRYLERDGTLLADIATPVSDPADTSKQFHGPFDPAISPDGTKVAYDYYWQYTGYDPFCNPSTNCYVKQLYQGTGFTRPDRLTGWDEESYKRQSGWVDPSWVGDENQVMISDPSQPLNEDVVVYSPGMPGLGGGEGSFLRWFDDSTTDLEDGELSRDLTKAAFVGDDGAQLKIARGMGGYPRIPVPCFAITGATGKYSSPSWSHDGTRLVWAEDDGAHVIALPDLRDGCGTPTETEDRLLIPGARNPDWGPADVPPARAVPSPAPVPAPGGGVIPPVVRPGTGGTPGAGAGGPTAARATLRIAAPSMRKALAKGLSVRVRGARPGVRRLTLRMGRRVVGGGTARIAKDGTGRAVVRFTRTGRTALGRRAKVVLTLTGAGATTRVTLTR